MDTAEAFEIVISLARQCVEFRGDSIETQERDHEAIDIVEDIAVNEYGDD